MPLWVGFGFLVLCGTGVFAKAGGILGFVTMRREGLLAGCGVRCRPGAAWDLRRCFVFRPLASCFLGLSPLTPLLFLAFVWSCGGVGFLTGVSACFSFGCSWWVCGQIW